MLESQLLTAGLPLVSLDVSMNVKVSGELLPAIAAIPTLTSLNMSLSGAPRPLVCLSLFVGGCCDPDCKDYLSCVSFLLRSLPSPSRYHRALMHLNRPHVADLDGADLSQLAALTSLQVLDLARTEVGDAAYAAIGAAVTAVRDLRLQYTHGTADGILGALVILLSLGRVGVREKRGGW